MPTRSFFVQPGMEISVREKSRKIKAVVESIDGAAHLVPDYLELNKENFKGKLVMAPELHQIESQLPLPINFPVVCEFLGHRT